MLDNYFSTGNVYVIDDQKNEAMPLIDSLFRHHIPHIYMDGTSSKLPKKPKQTRLIFLDLNLKQGTNPLDKKSFKNIHASIFNRLLANNSSSYVILVWSKEEKSYLNDFIEIFNDSNDEYNLNKKKPLEIISLDKSIFFDSNLEDETATVSYNWKEGQETKLFDLIEEKLKIHESFITLSSWESLISKSGSQTVDNLFDLVSGLDSSTMNSKLGEIISSLAISFMGIENFSIAGNQNKTDAFMLALSELVDDEIDKEIILKSQPEFASWTRTRIDSMDKSKLNSKLLTSVETENNKLTGSVFKGDKCHDYLKMFSECLDQNRSEFGRRLKDRQKENNELTPKDFKVILANEITGDISKFIPIEINLTPLCDVVQNKEEYYRIVPGFLIDTKSLDLLDTKTDRNYYSPVLYQSEDLKECKIVLDFRYLFSLTKDEIDKRKKICSLRKSFVDDIQSKLANHVSRLGILYLS